MRKRSIEMMAAFILGLSAICATGSVTAAQRQSVPTGTRLLLKLQTAISSKTNQVGDRFTAGVTSPRSYQGAVVEGHIARLKESGIIKGKTEIGFEFDSIRFRNGRTAPLDAELVEVRQSDSLKVVDEEGNIYSGSRGKQAIKRTAIGAAIGGVVGGLIGGRKGIVIGLIVGGGAGAGSLIFDGKKELKLEPGTEMMIQTVGATDHD